MYILCEGTTPQLGVFTLLCCYTPQTMGLDQRRRLLLWQSSTCCHSWSALISAVGHRVCVSEARTGSS